MEGGGCAHRRPVPCRSENPCGTAKGTSIWLPPWLSCTFRAGGRPGAAAPGADGPQAVIQLGRRRCLGLLTAAAAATWGVQAALHQALPPLHPPPRRSKSPPTHVCYTRSLLIGCYCDGVSIRLHITLLLVWFPTSQMKRRLRGSPMEPKVTHVVRVSNPRDLVPKCAVHPPLPLLRHHPILSVFRYFVATGWGWQKVGGDHEM